MLVFLILAWKQRLFMSNSSFLDTYCIMHMLDVALSSYFQVDYTGLLFMVYLYNSHYAW